MAILITRIFTSSVFINIKQSSQILYLISLNLSIFSQSKIQTVISLISGPKIPSCFYTGRDGVVDLRRCKKEMISTSSMLMRPEDFKDEGAVTNHLSLYGGYYDWDKKKLRGLDRLHYPKHLLVNCRGSVIVELTTDDKAAPVVYIRELDILVMRSYGPPERTLRVPARTIKYLQDGTVVPTEPNPKETKLTEDLAKKTKEVAALQQELATEKTEKKALAKRVAELEEANKNCGITPPTFRVSTKADMDYSTRWPSHSRKIRSI